MARVRRACAAPLPDAARATAQRRIRTAPVAARCARLARLERGQTGIALVDAGMRELWQTGWMHNRVRMVTASLLVKNLLHPWQDGARWFWDTLVDADLASNSLNWQWVAGYRAGRAPWFRIFNPDTQAERFDPDGDYRRRWVPEETSAGYPRPIVDLQSSRQRALDAYQAMRAVPTS